MQNSKLAMIVIFLMILVVGCSQPPASAPTQNTPTTASPAASGKLISVTIQGFKFSPADVTVNAGDTVEWTNEDSTPHTVESSDGSLKSDELAKGDKYRFTFTKAGKHDYICGIHPSMHGSVTVQ